MSGNDRDDRFRTNPPRRNTVPPWRRNRDAKALREIDALIEEAAKPASEVRRGRDADEGWF